MLAIVLALTMCFGIAPTALADETIFNGYVLAEIVPPKYDHIFSRDDDLVVATVQIGDKYGLIDAKGKEIVPCKYDEIRSFCDGLARVKLNDKYGFIDRFGEEVIPCKYVDAEDFSDGLACVWNNNRRTVIDTTGKDIIPAKYDTMGVCKEGMVAVWNSSGKWGFVDYTGKESVPCRYDEIEGSFFDGFAAVCMNGKWGFVDKTGWQVVPCQYDSVESFCNGLSYFSMRNGQIPTGRAKGLLNKNGEEITPCKYDMIHILSNGCAAVETTEGKYGLVDATGTEVISCLYDRIYDIGEGFVAVGKENTDYHGFYLDYHSDYQDMADSGIHAYKWAVFNMNGKEITPFKYDNVGIFREGLAAVFIGDSTTMADKEGQWGFINRTGEEVISCKYDYISLNMERASYGGLVRGIGAFYDGLALVGLDDKKGFIDATGAEITMGKYDGFSLPAECEGPWFSNGLELFWIGERRFSIDNAKRGFINRTGQEVVPCKYDSVDEFSQKDGMWAIFLENAGWGIIDATGTEIVPPMYDFAFPLAKGLVAIRENDKYGLLAVKSVATPSTVTYTANPTNDALTVDGIAQVPTAYKIGGANYFQLRDVAMLLNGTPAQFSVDYDEALKAVKITTGKPYSPLGWELAGAAAGSAEAIEGNNDIYINGVKSDFNVYKIGGNNFFQIRALGKALGFNVGWSKAAGMYIESNKPYSDAD